MNPFFQKSNDFFPTGFVEIRATTKERLGVIQAKAIQHLTGGGVKHLLLIKMPTSSHREAPRDRANCHD